MSARHLAEMSWEQTRSYLDSDDRLLLPFGSLEQNGPHLPLGTDTLVAEAIARAASERTGVAVAPSVPWGNAPADAGFAGTVSLSANLLNDLIVELCAAYGSHGFRRILILSGHLNNVWNVALVGGEVRQRGVQLAQVDVWRLIEGLGGDLTSDRELGFGHAGEMCTSIVLAVAPELVDRERLEPATPTPGWAWDGFAYHPSFMGFSPWDEISSIGTVGDPSKATEEVGREGLGRAVDYVVELLEGFGKQAPPPRGERGTR